MEAKAITKYIRISPRKMRIVIDTVRYKPVSNAFAILEHLKKKAARLTFKTLKSAVANAKMKKMDEARLYVSQIKADGGPTLKRFRPRAMGRAATIRKRTSHVTIMLTDQVPSVLRPPKKEKKKSSIHSAVSAPKKNFPS